MKIAYGYNRLERDFAGHKPDRIWLDTPNSNRGELSELFRIGLMDGDTLILLDLKDLGRGSKALQERAKAMGVTIEVRAAVKPPERRGKAPIFTPTKDQDDKIRALWHDLSYQSAYVMRRISEIMGHAVPRNHLNYRYGSRRNPKPE